MVGLAVISKSEFFTNVMGLRVSDHTGFMGQALEFDQHNQSIVNEFTIYFQGNHLFGFFFAALPGGKNTTDSY